MSETAGSGSGNPVRYELTITAEEAHRGISRILTRNGKRLQVNIPAGVKADSMVKLSNALQITDGKPGDILVRVKIRSVEGNKPPEGPEPWRVVEITDDTFEREVFNSKLPVVVDFWASWCGPCLMMSQVISEAAIQNEGKIKFCKINVDENPTMAQRYQAMSIPLLIFFKNGKEIERSVGAIPAAQLNSKLAALL